MNSGHAFTTLQAASRRTVATRVEAELSLQMLYNTDLHGLTYLSW